MGIQINGTTDTISATDGGLVVSGQQLTGVTNLQISGITTVGAGSTSAPSITPTGDSNTGIFFPTADTIAFVEGGVESARFDSNGRFGLGTATVTGYSSNIVHLNGSTGAEIHITTGGTGTAQSDGLTLYVRDSDGTAGLMMRESNALTFGTNDNERARLDSSGRLLVGMSSARDIQSHNAKIQLEGVDFTNSTFQVIGNANNSNGAYVFIGKSRGTAVGANTIVQSGDDIGDVRFYGADGTRMVPAALIRGQVDGTPGDNDMPGRLVFSTTADGASSPTERMRIAQNGVITIQNGAVAVIGTLTDGATITPDFAADCNFTVTLGGSRTIANPTNITAGQSGSIFIVQDGTGSRTLSWGSFWDFPGGTAPTLTTTANAVDRVDYVVRTSTSIHTVFTANYS